jgi:hypothetical protein
MMDFKNMTNIFIFFDPPKKCSFLKNRPNQLLLKQ